MISISVTIKHLYHQNEHQIGLYFDYNALLIETVKKINGIRWSKTNRCWYIKNNPENLKLIFFTRKGIVTVIKNDFFERSQSGQPSAEKKEQVVEKKLCQNKCHRNT